MNKYRVVLIPNKEIWDDFYKITYKCDGISCGYVMSPKTSVPHITLLSFEIEDHDLPKVWENISHFKGVKVSFENLKLTEKKDFNFAELSVSEEGLGEIKEYVFNIAKHYTNKFSERMLEDFNPHMGLVSSKLPVSDIQNYIDKSFLSKNKSLLFDIAIGTSHGFGEVREIIFE